jgi:hypothetical protein
VFAPFYRLEVSRNRDTGRVGLAVARTHRARARWRHHARGRAGGGLRARLELPD